MPSAPAPPSKPPRPIIPAAAWCATVPEGPHYYVYNGWISRDPYDLRFSAPHLPPSSHPDQPVVGATYHHWKDPLVLYRVLGLPVATLDLARVWVHYENIETHAQWARPLLEWIPLEEGGSQERRLRFLPVPPPEPPRPPSAGILYRIPALNWTGTAEEALERLNRARTSTQERNPAVDPGNQDVIKPIFGSEFAYIGPGGRAQVFLTERMGIPWGTTISPKLADTQAWWYFRLPPVGDPSP